MSILRKFTSVAAAFAVAATAVGSSLTAAAASDFAQYADALAEAGVISTQSTEAGYRLGDNITRAEIAKIAVKLSGVEVATGSAKIFSDVDAAKLGDLADYINAAAEAGIVSKANTKFRPLDLVTRAELVKMLLAAKGVEVTDVSAGFADVDAAKLGDLAGYINAAAAEGYITVGANFRPNDTATRGEAFKIAAGVEGLTGDDTDLGGLFGSGTTTTTGSTSTGTVVTPVGVGTLSVALNPTTPASSDVPANVARVPFTTFDVTASQSDIVINAVDLEAIGYGDYKNLDNVGIYLNDVKVSRERNFTDSKLTLDVVPGLVIKAGSTSKLVVAGLIASTDNTTYGIKVTGITSTAKTVVGAPVSGNLLKGVVISSAGVLNFTDNKSNSASDIKVGEDKILGSFKLNLDNDKEDVKLSTVKVKYDGSAKISALANLRLLRDGVEVAKSPVISNNSYVTFVLDNTVFPANISKTYTFDIKGGVTTDVGNTVKFSIENVSDIYAVGLKNGFNTRILTLTDGALLTPSVGILVKGSKIDVSFTEGTKDSARKDTKAFDFGTIKFKSNGGNYLFKNLRVTVDYNAIGAHALKNLKLGGVSADVEDETVVVNNAGVVTAVQQVLVFKDIALPAGVEKTLALTADVSKDAALNETYVVTVNFAKAFSLKDEDNNKTIEALTDVGTTQGLNSILSSTSGFDSKRVTVEKANITVSKTAANIVNAVVGGTVTLFKGELKAGSAADVKVTKLAFVKGTAVGVDNFDDLVSNVKLNIAGTTYDYSTLDSSNISFDGLSYTVKAGTSNKVAFEVVATLKDAAANSADILQAKYSTISAEDADNGDSAVVTAPSTTEYAVVNVNDIGALAVVIDTTKDNESTVANITDHAKTVRAGSKNVVLAKVTAKATQEGVKIVDAFFQSTNDLTSSFYNVRLVASDKSTVVANGTLNSDKSIEFKSANKEIAKDEKATFYIMADVRTSSNEADGTGNSGDSSVIKFLENSSYKWKVEGVSSKKDVTQGNSTLDVSNKAGKLELTSGAAAASSATTVTYSEATVVTLEKVTNSITQGSDIVVGKLKVVVNNGNKDKGSNEEIKAALKSVKIDFGTAGITFSGATVPTYSLKKNGSAVTLTDNGVSLVAGLGAANVEVDGTTYFDIVANIPTTDVTLGDTPAITAAINDITTDVVFRDGNPGTTDFGVVAGTEANKTISTSTK